MVVAHWVIANLATLSAILVPVITGASGYIVARSKARHLARIVEQETYLKRQKQLSDEQEKFFEEQNQFRQEMRDELKRVKDQLLVEQKRNLNLEDEIRDWKKKYNDLLMENQNLQIQITEMKVKLTLLSKENSENSEESENSKQGDEV